MGSAVAQTLANVMVSYFKIFILLPSDKHVLWSRADHVHLGTWGLARGDAAYPLCWGQVMQSQQGSSGGCCGYVLWEMGINRHGPDPASPSSSSQRGQIKARYLSQNPSPGLNQGHARLCCALGFPASPSPWGSQGQTLAGTFPTSSF